MPEFSTLAKHFLDLLSDKGASVSIVLTTAAFIMSASMRSTERLVEFIAEVLGRRQTATAQQKARRANDLFLHVTASSTRPQASPGLRRLRDRQRHATRRLDEVRALWKRQNRLALSASFINGLLVAANYVVGATLASSFIQKALSPNLTGTLGLVVVIASTVQQRYAPDILATAARERATILKRAILDAEDAFVEANREGDGTDFQRISSRLSAIISETEENAQPAARLKVGRDRGSHDNGQQAARLDEPAEPETEI